MDRKERLQKAGIFDRIIENVGAKLCDKCWTELAEKAPEEFFNLSRIIL